MVPVGSRGWNYMSAVVALFMLSIALIYAKLHQVPCTFINTIKPPDL